MLATLAASRTSQLATRGESALDALNGGFMVGFGGAVVLGLLAAAAAVAAPGRQLPPSRAVGEDEIPAQPPGRQRP